MDELKDKEKRAHYALHTLWSKAVGTPDYDKKQWTELDNAISDLIGSLKREAGIAYTTFGP